ncbi:MAG: flagellar protein FlgJ [Cellvibrionaceae bacterium]|jgi:flagellar protein FlgJ
MNNLPTQLDQIQSRQSYTDLNQLNDIKRLGKNDEALALKKVAKQFESMFVQMMLKNMRAANEAFGKDNPLNTSEMKFRQGMLDNQWSLSLTEGRGIGLADSLYRQLSQSYGSNSVADKTTGASIDPQRRAVANPYSDSFESIQKSKNDQGVLKNIKSPDEFIKAMLPYAEKAAAELGVDPKVLVAQSALETGWGEHTIQDRYGRTSFNLFNIKADSRWQGHSVNVPTIEYRDGVAQKESANFRRYDSIGESFDDYLNFIKQPRYEKALTVVDNSAAYVNELQQAGYATDPSYAKKINAIINDYFVSQ